MIRLVCMGMGGVLVRAGDFWAQVHEALGTRQEWAARAHGDDPTRLVDETVGLLWRGKDARPYLDLVAQAPFMPGIGELFATLDAWRTSAYAAFTLRERVPRAIISDGSYDVALRVKGRFGVDFVFANQPLVREGRMSGESQWPMGEGRLAKEDVVEQLCEDLDILPQQVLAIGCEESDLGMLRIAGTSIAFNPQGEALRQVATHVVEGEDLRAVALLVTRIREAQR